MKIIAGIGLAKASNENVPDSTKAELAEAKGDELSVQVAIAARLIKQIKQARVCDGVHIMTGGREKLVPEIMKAAGL